MPGTSTLAYSENPLITTVKSFIVQAPVEKITFCGANPIKDFTSVKEGSSEMSCFTVPRLFVEKHLAERHFADTVELPQHDPATYWFTIIMSVGQMSFGQMSVGKMTVGKMSAGPMFVGPMSVA